MAARLRHTMALAIEDFDDFYLRSRVIFHRYVGALCVEKVCRTLGRDEDELSPKKDLKNTRHQSSCFLRSGVP